MDFVLKKGIGFLVLVLLTSLSMAGAIEYLQVGYHNIRMRHQTLFYHKYYHNIIINDFAQVFHWPWLCEHEDTKIVNVLRASNFIISLTIWVTWILNPTDIVISSTAKITIVQVGIMMILHMLEINIFEISLFFHELK